MNLELKHHANMPDFHSGEYPTSRSQAGAWERENEQLPCISLHSVILLVGGWAVGLGLGLNTKLGPIMAISFFTIMIPYELLIKLVKLLRFMFGVKLKYKPAP